MTNTITDTADLAENVDFDEDASPQSDLTATEKPDDSTMNFHVQMHNYTLHDMEDLIVEAAARMIVGRHNENSIAKRIEEKCIDMLNKKATAKLEAVTAEIIEQPLTPSFGDKKPVTMREFLGLYGREYLTERVSSTGKPDSGYGSISRMDYILRQELHKGSFKNELDKATSAAVREIRSEVKSRHEALLSEQMKRFREALEKTTQK